MSDEILGELPPTGDALPATSTGNVYVNNDSSTNTPVQNTDTETWRDLYIGFSDQNINIAIEDAYTGGGGFLGAVEKDGAYSYVVPKITELFYKTRVSLSQYINYFAPYIDAKVDPVFAMGVYDYILDSGGKRVEEDVWLDFVDDATNTGKSLNAIRADAAKIAERHQVSYFVMDKTDDGNGVRRPIVYTKSPKDVDEYRRNDKNMKLESITFWETSERVDARTVRYVKYKWEPGFLTVLKSKPVPYTYARDKAQYEVEDVYDTGIDELNVYPMFSQVGEMGDYKPTLPPSFKIARMCAALYNFWNVVAYVIFKQGHSLLVFQGDVEGVRDPLSNCVQIPADRGDMKHQMPAILSPDPELPRMHIEHIKENIASMMAIMEHNGVSVIRSNEAESGASKAFDMIGTNQTLLSTTDVLKRADKWIKRMFNKFEARNSDQWEYLTSYPTEFFPDSGVEIMTLVDLMKEFEERQMKENVREILRYIQARSMKDTSPDRLTELFDDGDKYVDTFMNDAVPPRNENGDKEGDQEEGEE